MSLAAALPREWLDQLQQRLRQPPLRPRLPLLWNGQAIGSVEPELVDRLQAHAPDLRSLLRVDAAGVRLEADDLTRAFTRVADAMRAAGLAHAWRDEQLGVHASDGTRLGSIERAAVRPLGIATRAVHLAGVAPDGRHWVQQRAFDKANDPGLWDTLMGGMVPAADSLEQALARETWEEAGLRLAQLEGIAPAGVVRREGPTADVRGGYVVEHIDWYRCMVPEGVVPENRDGEVERFALVDARELRELLLANKFTLEAAAILTHPGCR